jgi:hypothetical protein
MEAGEITAPRERNVAYWGNNGQRVAQGLNRYAAIDPERTSGVQRSSASNYIIRLFWMLPAGPMQRKMEPRRLSEF